MGNRICKIVKPRDGAGIVDQDGWAYTYYLRDAGGNVIAVYDRDYSTPGATYTDELSLKEDHLYGSSRVGIRTMDAVVCTTTYTYVSTGSNGVFTGTFSSRTATAASTTNYNHELKRKAFELSNHLGNVLVTVSDARMATNSSGTVSAFTAVIESAQDYYAFGSNMVGRSITSSSYRYSFNGKEKDAETDLQDYGMRIYNERLGRFLSVDPLDGSYPWFSPYHFAGNQPIWATDLDGLEVKRQTIMYRNGWSEEIYTVKIKVVISSEALKAHPEELEKLKKELGGLQPISATDWENKVQYKLQYDIQFVDQIADTDPLTGEIKDKTGGLAGETDVIGSDFENKIVVKGGYENGYTRDIGEIKETFVHEIGHVMGLYHPDKEVPKGDPAYAPVDDEIRQDYLNGGQTSKSVMSYKEDRQLIFSVLQFRKMAFTFDRNLVGTQNSSVVAPENYDQDTHNVIRELPSTNQSYRYVDEDYDPNPAPRSNYDAGGHPTE